MRAESPAIRGVGLERLREHEVRVTDAGREEVHLVRPRIDDAEVEAPGSGRQREG